jgi:uncharacterized membrane protein YfcA
MSGDVWPQLVSIGAIAIFAGFIHSAIGFGFGMITIALLPFVIDGRSAHIVLSISSVPMLVMAAWTYREGLEKRSLGLALLGAAIFLPPGLLLFESASLDLLVRGTGLAVFVIVLLSLRDGGSSDEVRSRGGSCFVTGAVSGFLAGAVSIAAPPLAAFALRQGWSQARYKAFLSQCLLVISIYKVALLVIRSHVVGPVVWQIVVAALLAVVGVQLGAMASRDIPASRFKHLVAVALLTVSCMTMWRGQSAPSTQEDQATQVVTQEVISEP